MEEFLSGFGWLILYFVCCASGALVLRLTTKVPDEVFRKLLHCILLGSLSLWVSVFDTWWVVAVSAVLFAVAVYPFLWLAERIKGYSETLTERKKGELKTSLLAVFGMFSVVVTICWGFFSDRMLALASVYAWGFGDAAAALIGKRFGKHKILGKKTLEGTTAMFTVSLVSVIIVLALRGGISWYGCVLAAVLASAVSTVVELYTSGGMDTVTCPFAAMAVLVPMTRLLEV